MDTVASPLPRRRVRAAGPRLRPITVSEYHRMGEMGLIRPDERVELLNGRLIAMSPVGDSHFISVNLIASHFGHYLDTLERRRAFVSVQGPVRLDDFSEPEPDIALLRPGIRRVPSAADALLIVEVADATLAFDRGVKRQRYARAGIPEVWVVAVAERYIEVACDPQPDGAYAEVRRIGLDGHLTPVAFPDIAPLAIASLFAGWEDDEPEPDAPAPQR